MKKKIILHCNKICLKIIKIRLELAYFFLFYRKRNWIKCFTKKFFVWCCHLYTRVSNVVIYFLKKEIKGWHKYNCKFNIVENKYKMLISIKMRIGIFLCRKAKQTMILLVWQNINNDELKVIVKALLLHVSFKCPSFTNLLS